MGSNDHNGEINAGRPDTLGHSPAGEDAPGGQRRQLTLLFADLCDSTWLGEQMEAEHYGAMIAGLRELCQTMITRHGGLLVRVQGDGFLAIFGHPTAQEDDGRRAIEAALDLHAAVRDWRPAVPLPRALALHSGVHAGVVLVNEGDVMRGRVELLGAAPNVAARLSAAAGRDEIYVSAETLGSLSQFFVTEAVEDLSLKGRSEPLAVLRVRDRAGGVRNRFDARSRIGLSAFVGRQEELRALGAHLDLALAGQGSCLALRAGAGMGKTRLVRELCSRAEARGAQVHRGDCESYLAAEPMQPFLQILRSLFGLTAGLRPEEGPSLAQAALNAAGFAPPWAASELLRQLGMGEAGSGTPPGDPSRDGDEARRSAWVALFAALARQRVQVLVLDDWQWADDASRQMLGLLRRELGEQLLLVVAARDLDAPELQAIGARVLALEPLRDDEANQTIRQLLPGTDPFVAAEIRRRAGGNPLFLEELCLGARDAVLRGGVVTVAAASEPGSRAWLDALIASRVAQLPFESQSLLRIAAVIGNAVPAWLLAESAGEEAPSQAWQVLADHDLFYPDEQPGLWRFKHGLTRDAIYRSVGLQERQGLHRRIALALQRQALAGGQEESLESLAYHFGAGDQPQEAAHYAELAGDKAVAASALDRAKRQYHAALQALDSLPPRRENLMRWAGIAQRLGLACVFDASREDLEVFQRAAALAEAAGQPGAVARARYWLGYVSYALGESRQAIAQCERALEAVAKVDDAPLAVQIRATLGQAHVAAADYGPALSLLNEAIAIKRRHRSGQRPAVGLAYSLACAAHVYGDWGRFDEAHAHFAEALEVVGGGEHHEVGASVRGLQAAVYLWQGRWSEARDCAAAACRIGERVGSLFSYAMSGAAGGYAAWQLDHSEAALRALQDATAWLGRRQGGLFHSFNHGWLADVLGERGDRAGMRRHAALAMQRQRRRDLIGAAMAWRALARDAAQSGEVARVHRCMAQAERVAQWRASAHEQASNHFASAQFALMLGDRVAARPALDAALTAFEVLGMRWHLAQARALVGEV